MRDRPGSTTAPSVRALAACVDALVPNIPTWAMPCDVISKPRRLSAHLLLIVPGLEGGLVEDTVSDTEHQGGITSDLSGVDMYSVRRESIRGQGSEDGKSGKERRDGK